MTYGLIWASTLDIEHIWSNEADVMRPLLVAGKLTLLQRLLSLQQLLLALLCPQPLLPARVSKAGLVKRRAGTVTLVATSDVPGPSTAPLLSSTRSQWSSSSPRVLASVAETRPSASPSHHCPADQTTSWWSKARRYSSRPPAAKPGAGRDRTPAPWLTAHGRPAATHDWREWAGCETAHCWLPPP